MRCATPTRFAQVAVLLLLASCGEQQGAVGPGQVPVPGQAKASKSSALVRAERRAYDGAPPVMPHQDYGNDCLQCHDQRGVAIDGLGFAPPSPHGLAEVHGALQRCTQCHVEQQTVELFRGSDFVGLAQDLRQGTRLYPGAPPRLPHTLLMRENCSACHSGAAAREELRCTHPERMRCTQCHVPMVAEDDFVRRP